MPWGEGDARASEFRAGVGVGGSAGAGGPATGSPPSPVQPAISRHTIPSAASGRRTSNQPRRPGILISRWPTAVTLDGCAAGLLCRASRGWQAPLDSTSTRSRLSESLPPLGFSQHPNQHRPERPILLAIDQELGEGAALWVAPELADPIGALEVREHQDVEQL